MAERRNSPIITVKQPYRTSDGTLLYLGTSTEVQRDANGKYVPGSAVTSLRLYDTTFSPLGTDFKTVATRKAGEPWTFTQGADGKPIAGSDLQKTLSNQNSLLNKNLNNNITTALGAPLQGVPAGEVNKNTKQDANKATGLNQNTAKNEENTGNASNTSTAGAGSTDPKVTQQQLNNLVIGRSDIRKPTEYQNLVYPTDLESSRQDIIQFTMSEYVPKQLNTNVVQQLESGISQESFLGDRSKSIRAGQAKVSGGRVTLPIQPTISDSNAVVWNDQTINPFQAAVGSFASSLIEGNTNLEGSSDSKTNQDQQSRNALREFIGKYLAGEAAGGEGQQLFTRTTGAVLNPNLELLFTGPSLRSFNFTFTMSAREQSEAVTIKQIIRFFKQGMSVKRAESSLFLKTPHVFDIKYVYRGNGQNEVHPWLNTFKTCALTNCSVNYTPAGSYATFTDGAMTQYDLSLTFTELEPIYDDDYTRNVPNGNADTHIGY
jgi:hypothetical protein